MNLNVRCENAGCVANVRLGGIESTICFKNKDISRTLERYKLEVE
jgi:hypothetical protein